MTQTNVCDNIYLGDNVNIIMHIDVNNAFLSWSAVYMLNKGLKKDIRYEDEYIKLKRAKRKLKRSNQRLARFCFVLMGVIGVLLLTGIVPSTSEYIVPDIIFSFAVESKALNLISP